MIVDKTSNNDSIINAVFACNFRGKHILLNQIANSFIKRESGYAYEFLIFNVSDDVEIYPYKIQSSVPITMIYHLKNAYPVLFLLHIKKGIVHMIEIMTDDSSELNFKKDDVLRVEYEIDKNIDEAI